MLIWPQGRLSFARHHHTRALAKLGDALATGTDRCFIQPVSPFSKIKPRQRDPEISSKVSERYGKLAVETVHRVTKLIVPNAGIQCTVYTAGNTTIPPYTNYISTKRNILIEDDKHRTFLPYHGDYAYIDTDYAVLESKIDRNKSNYHRVNILTEKARLYASCAESFLRDVGCHEYHVLRYLLDETNPAVPHELPSNLTQVWLKRGVHVEEQYYDDSEEDTVVKSRNRIRLKNPQKQWQIVFDSLSQPSSNRDLAAAALACAVFAHLIGFSLWHIVRKHRLVLDAIAKKVKLVNSWERNHGDSRSKSRKSCDLLKTYSKLGCLVCYAYVLLNLRFRCQGATNVNSDTTALGMGNLMMRMK